MNMDHIHRELELRSPKIQGAPPFWNNRQINAQAPLGEKHGCWTACNSECPECTSGSVCEMPQGHQGAHQCWICKNKW
mgnify:CR=1 FL=1